MNTRPSFLLYALAALLLAFLPSSSAKAAPDTPAVAVVRQFLAARESGNLDVAYALLSANSRKRLAVLSWESGGLISLNEARKLKPPFLGLVAFFADPKDTLGYTFTVIGPNPDDPDVVLVRADPPGVSFNGQTTTLHILTVADLSTHSTQLDMLGSLMNHEPREFPKMTAKARRELSQSNLKQISFGIVQYVEDHNEIMPDAANWVDELMPYVKNPAIFRDPSAPAGEKWSYAYNRALSHKTLAQFDYPAHTVMLFESSKGVKNASDTGQSVPRPGRHLGGTDYATSDGHVQWFPDGTVLSYKLSGK